MWTQGAYDFRFEIYRSTEERPQVAYVPLKPQDIWNFNTVPGYRNRTWVRRAKWTYRVNPHNFTAKRVELASHLITLGKWDVSKEALTRLISVYEEDFGTETEYEYAYETTKLKENNFSGGLKFSFPIKKVQAEISGDAGTKNSLTEKVTHKTKVTYKKESDELALRLPIYYYDPIITGKVGDNYRMKTYGTGNIKFGIYVK